MIVRDPFGKKMEDLMANIDLLDAPLKNKKYTWNNKKRGPGHIASRLDRFIIISSLLQKDMLLVSLALPSTTSDHKPISLFLSPFENLGPITF